MIFEPCDVWEHGKNLNNIETLGVRIMALKDIVHFLQGVRSELSKVEWPKFDEFLGSTLVVLVLVIFFAIYLGIIDLGLSKLAKYIFTVYGGY
jgi:preprotein translocase subunit SecE